MASRLDAVQIAIPRAVTNAAQQHAAQRQPVIVQEQLTEGVRHEVRAREQRTGPVEGRDGHQVQNNLVAGAREREARGRRRGARGSRSANDVQPGQAASPGAHASDPESEETGTHVDLRL